MNVLTKIANWWKKEAVVISGLGLAVVAYAGKFGVDIDPAVIVDAMPILAVVSALIARSQVTSAATMEVLAQMRQDEITGDA